MSAFSPKRSHPPQRTSSNSRSPYAPAHSISHQHPILNLQRTIGNQAALRLLQADAQPGDAASAKEASAAAMHPGSTNNFGSIPALHTPVRGIQRKLMVNAPGDAYEQEADRVAEQVMRMPASQTAAAQMTSEASAGATVGIQRACSCGGTCDDCKKKHPQNEHARVQMKAAGPGAMGGVEAPPMVHEALRSPGQPLDKETRAFMEPRFGHDFSSVRVHTDAKAAESARAVGARAYTVGSNVVFGRGEFAPGAEAGQRLLGHELTHVVQQGAKPQLQRQPAPTPPTPGFSVNQADYVQMVKDSLQEMTGSIVQSNTLAPVIEPVLRSLASSAIWRDEKGKESGGAAVPIALPGEPKVTLRLRLVLDDRADPKDAGEFQRKGGDKVNGTIAVMVRQATEKAALSSILYHEASHMLVWAMQNWGASRFAHQDRKSIRALNLSLHSREIAGVKIQLEILAKSVNGRRAAAKQPQITDKQLDDAATELINEAEVRAETRVFTDYVGVQESLAQRGPGKVFTSGIYTNIDSAMIDQYVFDFSPAFQASDRTGLTVDDKNVLETLRQMLDGLVSLQVKRQFDLNVYTIGRGIPREKVDVPLAPLTPPTFRPLPMP